MISIWFGNFCAVAITVLLMVMPSVHRHQQMTGEHDQNKNEKGNVAAQPQSWCQKDQQQRQKTAYCHPYPVVFHKYSAIGL